MNKVAAVGVFGNILLTAVKLAAGIIGNSGAMVSDAIHSLSDVFATVVAWIGTRISGKKADKSHPYGHERFEVVASLILGIILLVTAVSIGMAGIRKIAGGDYGELPIPGSIALAAAIISIAAKEAMFWYTRHYAKKLGSQAFMAAPLGCSVICRISHRYRRSNARLSGNGSPGERSYMPVHPESVI